MTAIDLTHLGTRDGRGPDVSSQMQDIIDSEVGSLSQGQIPYPVVFDLGNYVYRMLDPLQLQQKRVHLENNFATFICAGDHGVVIDYDDAASNPEYCRISKLSITGAKSHGIHAKAAHYFEMEHVNCYKNGGDGILIEGAVEPRTNRVNCHYNGGYGYREKTYIKTYNKGENTTNPILVRKSDHRNLQATGNVLVGIASWESHNATFDTPTVQLNGGDRNTNTEGVGIQLHSTLSAEIRTPYTELHNTDIQITDEKHEYASRVAAITGRNRVFGGMMGGQFIKGKRPLNIDVDSFGTSIDNIRLGGHLKISGRSRNTVIGHAVEIRGRVNNSGIGTNDLR